MPLFHQASEVGIATLVDRFCEKVRRDPRLGPLFERAIGDWNDHRRKLRDFWSAVVLRSERYQGNTLGTHRALPAFPRALFQRWLTLWRETAMEVFEPVPAELFAGTAERHAEDLCLGLGMGRLMLDRPSRVLGPLHLVS
jgi:hemoglobin